jgi:cystathionine beta-lyase
VAEPEATYLLWLDMTAYGLSSDELVEKIAKAGAGLNSGLHYGDAYDGFVRMNIACPKKQLISGLECIKNALII